MPKISYIDKINNGKDTAQVTVAQVEQKIADIEALLRGMIDVENVLSSDDSSDTVPLSPSNVVDMPVETRPVEHCMKFFGITDEHDTGIVERLFEDITDHLYAVPDMSMVGGIGDQEIFLLLDKLTSERKTVTIEFPFYYVPMTVQELWELVAPDGTFVVPNLKYSLERKFFIEPLTITTIDEFYKALNNANNPTDILFEGWYNVPANIQSWGVTDPVIELKKNSFNYTCDARAGSDTELYACRYGLAVLCKVNP